MAEEFTPREIILSRLENVENRLDDCKNVIRSIREQLNQEKMPENETLKLGSEGIAECHDCKKKRECVWDICPYDADINNETDPNKALWLCRRCSQERADDI